eukprot:6204145-Pleurochrysis_carterae.AAC.4
MVALTAAMTHMLARTPVDIDTKGRGNGLVVHLPRHLDIIDEVPKAASLAAPELCSHSVAETRSQYVGDGENLT